MGILVGIAITIQLYRSFQNMQCLVIQILLQNMLKFHSDMAKQKSHGNESCLQYYTVLDSPQVFKNGISNLKSKTIHHDLALYSLKYNLFR